MTRCRTSVLGLVLLVVQSTIGQNFNSNPFLSGYANDVNAFISDQERSNQIDMNSNVFLNHAISNRAAGFSGPQYLPPKEKQQLICSGQEVCVKKNSCNNGYFTQKQQGGSRQDCDYESEVCCLYKPPPPPPTPVPSQPCTGNNYACVAPNLCQNGEIKTSNFLKSASSGKCYAPEVCCRIPEPESTVLDENGYHLKVPKNPLVVPTQKPYQPQPTQKPYQQTPKPYQPTPGPYQPTQNEPTQKPYQQTPKPYQPQPQPQQPYQPTQKPYQPQPQPQQPYQPTQKPYQPQPQPQQPYQPTQKPYQPQPQPQQPYQPTQKPYQPQPQPQQPYQPTQKPYQPQPQPQQPYQPTQKPYQPQPQQPYQPTQKPYQPKQGPYQPQPQPTQNQPTQRPYQPQPQPQQPYQPTQKPYQPQPQPQQPYQPTQKPYQPQPQPQQPYQPITQKPRYPVTSAPQYLPPTKQPYQPKPTPPRRGEDQLSLPIPKPDRPRPPLIGNDILSEPQLPQTCAAALNCTRPEYCSATGVIQETPVILTPEQELFRVPMTKCQDQVQGFTGVCCRDPNYVDPWPVSQLGQYNAKDFGDDGSYKPDPGVSRPQRRVGNVNNAKVNRKSSTKVNRQAPTVQCVSRNSNSVLKGIAAIDADFGEYPWQTMVLLESTKSLLCGGAIVSDDVVITAAHCVTGRKAFDVLVKAGEWKLGRDEEPLTFQISRVKKIEIHPQYNPSGLQYDIAILHLDSKLKFDTHIGPICIDETEPTSSEQCITTGWGKEVLRVHAQDAIMHHSPVTAVARDECGADESKVCGKPDIDGCELDPGSALACRNSQGQYVLKGIFSAEDKCGDSNISFTKPDSTWINSAIYNKGKSSRIIAANSF